MRARWGFVGRTAEFTRLVESATDPEAGGLIFCGTAGIGKSRLLREGTATLDQDRFAVLTATATAAVASLPFGGLAHVLPGDQPAGLSPAGLLRWAVDALRRQAGHRRIVLAVDDAHLLDPISALLVAYVVRTGQATLIATLRSDEPVPPTVRSLWTEGLIERVDVGPLTEDDTAGLLTQVLGGDVDLASARRLWQLSQGNALLLRELVLAAQSAGELTEQHGLWRWTGRLELAPSLVEVVDSRIGALDPGVRSAVEYVAFGEPLGLRLLSTACEVASIELAEERQLIRVSTDGRRVSARLAHPMYGEIARQRCPVTRAQRTLAELADLVEGAGAQRGDDLLRVATWRLDSGTANDPGPLHAAGRQAFARFDIPLALRLLTAAVAAGGGFDAADGLAQLLMFSDQPERAGEVIDGAESLVTTDAERAQWHAVRGIISYWGLGDEDTPARMAAATATLPDLPGRVRLQAIESMMRLHHNERDSLAALVTSVREAPSAGPGERALALSAAAHRRAASGEPVRTVREMAEVDAGSHEWRAETPYYQLAVEIARGTAMILAVDLAAVDAVIADENAGLADAGDFHLASGYLTLVRAQAARLRGRLGDAVRFARLARARLAGGRIFSGLACAELAHAAALCGDTAAAAAAMAEADQVQLATTRILYPHLEMARAWTLAGQGDQQGACATLRRLVARLAADGFAGYAVPALHDLVRLGQPAEAADELVRLARVVEGPFAVVAARHARAAVAGDVPGLLRAAAEFESVDLLLHAAEAATEAVKVAQRSRSGLVAEAASRRGEYLSRCDGVQVGTLALQKPTLTERERQIARRAAAGVSSRQIADELHLSRRTVDNHLLRIYTKLGVHGRPELGVALGALTAAPQG